MLSLFDRLWHKDLTEEEAVQLMEKGIEEVTKKRFVTVMLLPLTTGFNTSIHQSFFPL